MKYVITLLCLVFGLTTNAYEDVKVRASKEDLKKMAEFEKKHADEAEKNAAKALKTAKAKKRMGKRKGKKK